MQELIQYRFGEPTAQPNLLIVHGLFGSARNWQSIAKHLSADRQVICVDLRNHGHSFWHGDHSYDALADDLLALIAQLDRPLDVLGHSMGGKAVMNAALKAPEQINRLVVVDVAPVRYTHNHIDNVKAMQDMPLAMLTSRREADQFLQTRIDDAPTRAFFLQSLDFSAKPPRWRLNLEALAQNMEQILGFPPLQGCYDRPCLMVYGAQSNYVLPQHHNVIITHFAQAQFIALATGHWVHVQAPADFLAAVQGFLS